MERRTQKHTSSEPKAHPAWTSAARCLDFLHGVSPLEACCRVEVVSSSFKGQSMIQCHRTVYSLLDEELKNGVHALSLRTKAS